MEAAQSDLVVDLIDRLESIDGIAELDLALFTNG